MAALLVFQADIVHIGRWMFWKFGTDTWQTAPWQTGIWYAVNLSQKDYTILSAKF